MSFQIRNNIEVLERNSLKNLTLFLVKCVSIMKLLNIIGFEGKSHYFAKLWEKLDKTSKKQMETMSFEDLIQPSNNSLIRKLLELSFDVVNNQRD